MKTYSATFNGRLVGAIGVMMGWHSVTVTAENESAARLKLYDTHEHITRLTLTEIPETTQWPTP